MNEAVLLAGGEGLRLKGRTKTPKPLLPIFKGVTLLEYQLLWLDSIGIKKKIVACNTEVRNNLPDEFGELVKNIKWSVENKKLGTGGALSKALSKVKEEYVYVMNVDDIILDEKYTTNGLEKLSQGGGAILVSKPTLGFGQVELSPYQDVIRFIEKPELDLLVNAGHYVFNINKTSKYLPEKGSLEYDTLKVMAYKRMLKASVYNGIWRTLNTYKDLMEIKKLMKEVFKK